MEGLTKQPIGPTTSFSLGHKRSGENYVIHFTEGFYVKGVCKEGFAKALLLEGGGNKVKRNMSLLLVGLLKVQNNTIS